MVAIPYPTVHRGGIRAVAIATPAITVPVRSFLVCATMPAKPPNNAIRRSYVVGDVLANSSLLSKLIRGSKKNSVDVTRLTATIIRKLRNEDFSKLDRK